MAERPHPDESANIVTSESWFTVSTSLANPAISVAPARGPTHSQASDRQTHRDSFS
jgi:hypothetical protein